MDQLHVVRHKVLVEGRTQRSVARDLGMSRVTVRKYLDQAAPSRVETAPRERPVWEAVGPRIEALLVESAQWTGGKQRLPDRDSGARPRRDHRQTWKPWRRCPALHLLWSDQSRLGHRQLHRQVRARESAACAPGP
jgi:hypothetical protein